MIFKNIFLASILLLMSLSSVAQLSFSRSDLLQSQEQGSRFPMGIADINGDHRDDVVRLIDGQKLQVDLQVTGPDQLVNKYILNTSGGPAWTLGVGDFNNDYVNDFMTSGFYNGAFVYLNKGDDFDFELSHATDDDFYAQASNIVDINNDGLLDLFICNDDGLNKIYINTGKGVFSDQSDLIDMITAIPSDNSGNYGSVWTDVDGDNDLDLFIAKCRSFVDDFEDPRRINALFINDNGTFVESAEAFGLASGAQSWAADFADIDNDGDLDCYVSNHSSRHILYENIDNQNFVEIDSFAGEEILSNNVQSYFEDFDNDGYVDIIISGPDDIILINNGNKSFTRVDDFFGAGKFQSCVTGDLNNDGFVDVIATFFNGLQSNTSDVLFLNDGNENNFLSVAFRGVESNTNGVGAKVEIYTELGRQMRIVKSGISYGITKSLIQRFGLGADQNIDSLVIHWPSGQTDSYQDIVANQHLLAVEGSCISPLKTIDIMGSLKICDGDQVSLTVSGADQFEWSTEETTSTIEVGNESFINAQVFDQACYNVTNTIFVDNINDDRPSLSIDADQSFCFGDTLAIETDFPGMVLWSNDQMAAVANYTETGPVWLEVNNNCGLFRTDTFNVEFLVSNIDDYFEFLTDSLPLNLTASGNNVVWYNDAALQNILATGNNFVTGNINQDTVFYVQNIEQPTAKAFNGGASTDLIDPNNKYTNALVNGALLFRVDKAMILESVKVETQELGKRRVIILKDGATIMAKDVEITEQGISTLDLDFQINVPGMYSISTDIAINMSELGSTTCWFARLDTGVAFPYALGDLGEIINSEWGAIYYHHFFDWEVSELKQSCVGNVAEYVIDTDFTSGLWDNERLDVKIYPNPAKDLITIESEEVIVALVVRDLSAKIIFSKNVADIKGELNVEVLQAGVYFIEIKTANKKEMIRFSKF